MPTTHRLKTIGRFWDAVESGEKTFEVRKNDRGFQTGDTLELWRLGYNGEPQFMPPVERHGLQEPRLLVRKVTFLLQGGKYGIDPLYCVLGLGAVV